jgi:hypothetical protein
MTQPTFREMNLRVFRREPLPHVFFQPRIEPWYQWHRTRGILPEELTGLDLPQVYDALPAAMRYFNYHTGLPSAAVRTFDPVVKIETREQAGEMMTRYSTPYGELNETQRLTEEGSWRIIEHLVRQPEDFKKVRWLYENSHFEFSEELFEQGRRFFGERGTPQFFLPRSPYQALAIELISFDKLVYALADYPAEVEAAMGAIDAANDRLFDQIAASGKVEIIGFGENVEAQLLSPRYFERYLLPYYVRRVGQMRQAGIFTHLHVDGNFHALLRFFKDLPFDALEALTPAPMGDATYEDIKAYLGDKILLDGLPAVYFMDTYPLDDLIAAVDRMVALFHPRLVLGISDELPQGGGHTAWERCKIVAKYCQGIK